MAKWTDYTTDTNPTDTDEVMTLDADKSPKANNRVTLSTLADYFLDKLASKVFAKLETKNQTVIGALNELNSKGFLTDSKWSDAHVFSGRIFLLYLNEVGGSTLYLIAKSDIIRIAGYRSQSSNILATSYDESKSETTITNSEGGCSMFAIRIN